MRFQDELELWPERVISTTIVPPRAMIATITKESLLILAILKA